MTTIKQPIRPTSSIERIRPSDSRLFIPTDRGVQRLEGVTKKKVDTIATNFNPESLGLFIISERPNGALAIIDGAHRWTACKRVGYDELVDAKIYRGLSIRQEAQLFSQYNFKTDPTALSKFLARVTGGDSIAVDIARIIENSGWMLSKANARGNFVAVSAAEAVYTSASGVIKKGAYPEILGRTMNAIISAWGYDPRGGQQNIIKGIGQIIGHYGDAVTQSGLVKALGQKTPAQIIASGRALHETSSASLPAATGSVIVGLYNKRRKTNALPDWTWTK